MTRPVDAVIEFLQAEQARGVTHIMLDEGAREGLRGLARRTRTTAPDRPGAANQPAPKVTAPQPVEIPTSVNAVGTNKVELLASLRQQAETWQPARSLGTLREKMVFASGNPDARVMLVGEAPGYEEEKKSEPFAGPAGQKLSDILKAMGLTREEVYLSHIVKFRPATARQTTNNRPPNPEEIASCLPFIRAEVEIVQPACIIALGDTAAKTLSGNSATVESLRGAWHEFGGVPLRVTYHPSYLLRSNADHTSRRKLWEDMLAVMEKLGMPISEKQRGFFLPKK